jgi:cytoskeletal protein RodZ
MKAWMWILIAVLVLGGIGAFLYFKMRKTTTSVAATSPDLSTGSTTKVTTVAPLTSKTAAVTTKSATDSPVADAVVAIPASSPSAGTNWNALAKEVYTPTLEQAAISDAYIAQLAAATYTPQKAASYTEQEWAWRTTDAAMLEALGGWPASVALA